MKIYRISQEIIEYNGSISDYVNIGHDNYLTEYRNEVPEENERPVLWVWHQGRLVTKIAEAYRGHREWGFDELEQLEKDDSGNFPFGEKFYGRYEPKSGKLSVAVPYKFRNRQTPNRLIKDLNQKFNPKQIHLF